MRRSLYSFDVRINKLFEGAGEERSAMTSAADYSRLRAMRLFALAPKLRELGNTDYVDAVAAMASQSLEKAAALEHSKSRSGVGAVSDLL